MDGRAGYFIFDLPVLFFDYACNSIGNKYLSETAVENPHPPSHGCRPVQLVHAEVGPH